MNVLVIAPHMDDEILGVGGTIARHVRQGDRVHVCIVANRAYNHHVDAKKNKFERACAVRAQKALGYQGLTFLNLPDERLDECLQNIIIPLEACVKRVKPEIVYVNHFGDNNQDHRAVFQAAMVALRPAANQDVERLYAYETPSSTDQSPPILSMAFQPNYYVNISKSLKVKISALKEYRTELKSFPHPRSSGGLETLARKRGMECGFAAAEAFIQLRGKWS